MKYYSTKNTAFKHKNDTDIICNKNIKKYFILNDYHSFLDLIKKSNSPSFYEFIPSSSKICMFLDIEIYKNKQLFEYNNYIDILAHIKNKIRTHSSPFFDEIKFIILESHKINDNPKISFHIIIRVKKNNIEYYFENVKILKSYINELFPDLIKKKIIDTSVYREGLFRTIFSTKDTEQRYLIKSSHSDDFSEIESFVCYTTTNFKLIKEQIKTKSPKSNTSSPKSKNKNSLNQDTTLSDSDKNVILNFVKKNYNYDNRIIREIFINNELNCIIISLNERYCHNIEKEHQSNNQYIVIDTFGSKRKCHDLDCKDHRFNEIKIAQFPSDLITLVKNVLSFTQELELIANTGSECKNYINSRNAI